MIVIYSCRRIPEPARASDERSPNNQPRAGSGGYRRHLDFWGRLWFLSEELDFCKKYSFKLKYLPGGNFPKKYRRRK
jgi:hypothetical protein